MVYDQSGIVGRARDWAAVGVEQMSTCVVDWGSRHIVVEGVAGAEIRSES